MSSETLEPAANPAQPATIWNKSFIILFFANMSFNMGMNMSNSLLAIYSDSLGASAAVIGLVASSFGISAILFRLISAPIMDTYNRKYLVIYAALLLAVAFWGYSISTGIPMLIGFRLLQGCGMAFGNACCLAMVADMLPRDKYSSGLGYYSLAAVACSAVGPSVGLELVGLVGFRMTYTLTACFMLFSAFLIFMIKTNFKRTKKLKLTFQNIIAKEALLPVGIQLIIGLGHGGMHSFLFLFARYQGVSGNIGLYFTVSAIVMLVTRPVFGRLTDRYGLIKIAIPAMACTIASVIIISYSTTLSGFLCAAVVAAFGQGAFSPAMQALIMKSVPSERRGSASSTNYIGIDLSSMIGPALAGQIVQTFGYITMWRVMVIPMVVGTLVLHLCRKSINRIEEEFAAGSITYE